MTFPWSWCCTRCRRNGCRDCCCYNRKRHLRVCAKTFVICRHILSAAIITKLFIKVTRAPFSLSCTCRGFSIVFAVEVLFVVYLVLELHTLVKTVMCLTNNLTPATWSHQLIVYIDQTTVTLVTSSVFAELLWTWGGVRVLRGACLWKCL